MKKHLSLTLTFGLCLTSVLAALADAALVKDGQPIATINSPAVPLPPAKMPKDKRGRPLPEPELATAVRELNYHLQKKSGASLPVGKSRIPLPSKVRR